MQWTGNNSHVQRQAEEDYSYCRINQKQFDRLASYLNSVKVYGRTDEGEIVLSNQLYWQM